MFEWILSIQNSIRRIVSPISFYLLDFCAYDIVLQSILESYGGVQDFYVVAVDAWAGCLRIIPLFSCVSTSEYLDPIFLFEKAGWAELGDVMEIF